MLAGAVLLVEDDAFVRRALLRAAGKQIDWLVADTVAKASSVIDEAPALTGAVVDVRLPDGCGFQIAERVRKVWPTTAILMVSAHDPHELMKRGFALHATVMPKPFTASDLQEWLRRATLAAAPDLLEQKRAHALLELARRRRLKRDQVRILQMRLGGYSNQRIAAEIGLSIDSVKKRLSRIFAATGLRNARDLARALDDLDATE